MLLMQLLLRRERERIQSVNKQLLKRMFNIISRKRVQKKVMVMPADLLQPVIITDDLNEFLSPLFLSLSECESVFCVCRNLQDEST